MLRGNNLKHSINLNIQRCITPTSCHISLCSLHSQTSGNQSDIRSLRSSFAETDSTDGFVSRLSHETQGRTELTFFPALCQTVPAADMNSSPARAAPAARSQPVLRQEKLGRLDTHQGLTGCCHWEQAARPYLNRKSHKCMFPSDGTS